MPLPPDPPPCPACFENRRAAGRALAQRLQALTQRHPLHDALVLALPRGGVPVAHEIALALQAPLDVLLVRKLGAPGMPELGLGAVAEGEPPQRVLNPAVMQAVQPGAAYLEHEERRQLALLAQRREALRRGRPALPVAGRTVVLVDDGIATGGTVRVALQVLRQAGAGQVTVAAPVAPADAAALLGLPPDALVALLTPEPFHAVGASYRDFTQVEDAEVLRLLDAARPPG